MTPVEELHGDHDSLSDSNKHSSGQLTAEKSSFGYQSNAPLDALNLPSTQPTFQHLNPNVTHPSPPIPPLHFVINVDPLQQMKDFVKPFSGSTNENVTKWIESVIHFFDVLRLPGTKEALYFQYAPAFLKEYAFKWWMEHKRNITDWSTFTQLLTQQFGERNEYLIEQRLNQRKQQFNEPVIKYFYDMLDLCRQYDPEMSNKQKIQKLINGLRLILYQDAIKDTYANPSEFLSKVQHLENIQRLIELRQTQSESPTDWHNTENTSTAPRPHQQDRQPHRSKHHRPSSPQMNAYQPTTAYPSRPYHSQNPLSDTRRATSTNWHTSMNDAYPSHLTSNRRDNTTRTSPIRCYNCGEMGHIARRCTADHCMSMEHQQRIHHSKNQ